MAVVKEAYTTKELLQLLGVEVHTSITRRAKRECWQSRPRKGRGGGNEWLLESMPEKTRLQIAGAIATKIAQADSKKHPAIMPEVFTVNTVREIPKHQRKRATARAFLVNMARSFQKASGSPRTTAYEVFCHEYNRQAIEAPEWVRNLLPTVCRKSLTNWEDSLEKNGLEALVGKHGRHLKGAGIIDSTPGMAEVVIAHIVKFYDETAEEVLDALKVTHAGQRLPSLRNLQRWMKKYREENPRTILKIQNPDAFRSKHQAAFGSRSADVYKINQLWELDSSPADILLADGKRYTLIGGIDVGTRRTRLKLAKTSNAQGVCSLLRHMLLDFGVPETIKMDNGADYASFRISNVLFDLQIQADYCTPFSPEEKPHIERFFGTFQRRLKKQPGFIGHSVADRKAIESQRSFAERISRKQGTSEKKSLWELPYTPEEFQAFCDHFCTDLYGERKHSELGTSPNEAAATMAMKNPPFRINDERALDILLMPIPGNEGKRRVTKSGIQADNGFYISAELGAFIGDDVLVRMDEDDAGRIYVFDLNGIFLCTAEDSELMGVSKRDIAIAAKRLQKAVEGQKAKEAKKVVAKVKPQELIPDIIAMQQREAAENRAERELRLGAEPSREFTTPALEQAAIAARVDEAPASTLNEQEREAIRSKAEKALTQTEKWKIPASDPEKYIECCRLMAADLAGVQIPFEAANWMLAWQNSRTFKTFEAVRIAGEQAKAKSN